MEVNCIEDLDVEIVKFKQGNHTLSYQIGPTFFTLFPESQISHAQFDAEIQFEKKSGTLNFHFLIKGSMQLECDRCLETLSYPTTQDFTLLVKISSEPGEEEEHLTYIYPGETHFGLAKYIYEMIHLSIPLRKSCEDVSATCNQDMIQFLEKNSSAHAVKDEKLQNNPEFDKLKNLFNKDS